MTIQQALKKAIQEVGPGSQVSVRGTHVKAEKGKWERSFEYLVEDWNEEEVAHSYESFDDAFKKLAEKRSAK